MWYAKFSWDEIMIIEQCSIHIYTCILNYNYKYTVYQCRADADVGTKRMHAQFEMNCYRIACKQFICYMHAPLIYRPSSDLSYKLNVASLVHTPKRFLRSLYIHASCRNQSFYGCPHPPPLPRVKNHLLLGTAVIR